MLYIKKEGKFLAAAEDDVIAEATEIYDRYFCRGTVIHSPMAAASYVKLRLAQYEHEVFMVIFLNNQHRIISCDEVFRGTLTHASVHPREIIKLALRYNAAAVIFAHNHPSGIAEASSADIAITKTLKTLLAAAEIQVLDHLVCGETVYSFVENNLLTAE